jgi:hypothetical protein
MFSPLPLSCHKRTIDGITQVVFFLYHFLSSGANAKHFVRFGNNGRD